MKTIQMILVAVAIGFALAGCAGKPGVRGDTGAAGPKGDIGTPGIQGPAGQDGKIALVVTLCPGHTHYSDTFVEVALCINNKLYGVYSANGGFLTELPPGNYSSNGIGSACNLTVKENCVVDPL